MSNKLRFTSSRIALALLLTGVAGATGYFVHGKLGPSATSAVSVSADATRPEPIPAAQVDQLTAPVALYPDGLLAQVLMASKHPDDVVAAAAWSKAHPDMKGQAAIGAVASMPWDASVKSLVAFPQALQTLAADPSWMRKIGDEFAANPANVMQSTQRLRKMASAAGTLRPNAQQRVVVVGETIRIVPVDPKVIYVPAYNAALVYGAWPYRDFPPIYAPAPVGYAVGVGLSFGAGVALGAALWSDVDWRAGRISVNYSRVNLESTNVDINYNEYNYTSTNIQETHVATDEIRVNDTHESSARHDEESQTMTPVEPTHIAPAEPRAEEPQAVERDEPVHATRTDRAMERDEPVRSASQYDREEEAGVAEPEPAPAQDGE